MKRAKLKEQAQPPKRKALKDDSGGLYFSAEGRAGYFSSGCTVLDCILGGGWAEGRVANIVGDKSTGKTLLAIEAAANWRLKYPDAAEAPIRYLEVESAFDKPYAHTVGLPHDGVEFPNDSKKSPPILTVEAMFKDLESVLKRGKRTLYIIDSLDALSDDSEQGRDVDAGTYGGNKAKKMSELFRRLNAKLSRAKVTVLVISQVRDAIGVTFGRKHTRAGGKALDFYASQILWLAHLKRLTKTRKGVTRPYGVKIRAQAEKSKVGLPYRTCDFPLLFAFGVEDVVASVEWLLEVKQHGLVFSSEDAAKKFIGGLDRLSREEYEKERHALREAVLEAWQGIERDFQPRRSKY